MKYVCPICGYVYDEAKEKTPFAALPESWVCPVCGAPKSVFVLEEEKEEAKALEAPIPLEEDMQQLSAGELSALCSNLARGCEKQYKATEAALFQEIADYFAAAAPEIPEGNMTQLSALIQEDLGQGYPELTAAAKAAHDRGTQRICLWGEKVTRMLSSLLQRYEREGEDFLRNTQVWVCTVCGFIYVGDTPPELCPVCKVPSWKFEKTEGRASV